MSHFYYSLILSCGMSWYGNFLFYFIYFDLYETDTLVIVKNIVTTPKSHNIFTSALFLVVVSLGLIVYYILFWSVRNWHLNNCKNIMTIYCVGIITPKTKIIYNHI